MDETVTSPAPDSVVAAAEITLDLTGLKCPLPVLKARRQLRDMAAGARLDVRADDPAAPLDFDHFCETAGHVLIETVNDDTGFTFRIAKGHDAKN